MITAPIQLSLLLSTIHVTAFLESNKFAWSNGDMVEPDYQRTVIGDRSERFSYRGGQPEIRRTYCEIFPVVLMLHAAYAWRSLKCQNPSFHSKRRRRRKDVRPSRRSSAFMNNERSCFNASRYRHVSSITFDLALPQYYCTDSIEDRAEDDSDSLAEQ